MESPIHSMIFNPDDPLFADLFTVEELDEIREFNSIEFDQPIPADMHEYLYSFEGVVIPVGILYEISLRLTCFQLRTISKHSTTK